MSTSSPPQGGFIRHRAWTSDLYNEGGYTLLEIIIAIAILSIALIPMMEMLPRSVLLETQLERETKVAFLAQQKMEEVKGKVTYDFDQDRSQGATPFAAPDSDFKYTVSDDQADEIKEIGVKVWYDADGDESMDYDEEQIELNIKIAKRY